MAAGRPVVCLDLGGPGVLVTSAAGFKIQPINPEQAIAQMAAVMVKLADDQDLRSQMGAAGRAVVRNHYNWDRKIPTQIQMYEQILS